MRKHTKFGKVQPKKNKTKKHFETARGEQAGRRNPKAATGALTGAHLTQIILRFPKPELNTSSKPIFFRLPRRLLFDI